MNKKKYPKKITVAWAVMATKYIYCDSAHLPIFWLKEKAIEYRNENLYGCRVAKVFIREQRP